MGMGETAGGDRPQRGFIRKAIEGLSGFYIILSTVIRSIDIQPKMIPNIP